MQTTKDVTTLSQDNILRVYSKQAFGDVWHNRLRNAIQWIVTVVASIPETGVVAQDPFTSYDTRTIGKSQQNKHFKQAVHKAEMQLICVYTDLLGPITPVENGKIACVTKFTDKKTRHKIVYLLSTKDNAIHSLVRYVQDVAIPNGL